MQKKKSPAVGSARAQSAQAIKRKTRKPAHCTGQTLRPFLRQARLAHSLRVTASFGTYRLTPGGRRHRHAAHRETRELRRLRLDEVQRETAGFGQGPEWNLMGREVRAEFLRRRAQPVAVLIVDCEAAVSHRQNFPGLNLLRARRQYASSPAHRSRRHPVFRLPEIHRPRHPNAPRPQNTRSRESPRRLLRAPAPAPIPPGPASHTEAPRAPARARPAAARRPRQRRCTRPRLAIRQGPYSGKMGPLKGAGPLKSLGRASHGNARALPLKGAARPGGHRQQQVHRHFGPQPDRRLDHVARPRSRARRIGSAWRRPPG